MVSIVEEILPHIPRNCEDGEHYFLYEDDYDRYDVTYNLKNGKLSGLCKFMDVDDGRHRYEYNIKCYFMKDELWGKITWTVTWSNKGYTIAYCKRGKLHGPYRVFKRKGEGLRVDGRYRQGKLDGEYKSYFKNGNQKMVCRYQEGKLDGDYKSFFKNGNQKVVCRYNNGKLMGEYFEYYETGVLHKYCSNHNEGEIDGIYAVFFENGDVKYESCMRNGVKHGVTKTHSADSWNVFKQIFNKDENKSHYAGSSNVFEQIFDDGVEVSSRHYTQIWVDDLGKLTKRAV